MLVGEAVRPTMSGQTIPGRLADKEHKSEHECGRDEGQNQHNTKFLCWTAIEPGRATFDDAQNVGCQLGSQEGANERAGDGDCLSTAGRSIRIGIRQQDKGHDETDCRAHASGRSGRRNASY